MSNINKMKEEKMKNNYVTIALVVDRSGSMEMVRKDTIGGINTFIKAHKDDQEGETTVTIAQFDNKYEVTHDFIDLKKVKKFTKNSFIPRGGTALLDAIGLTVDNLGKRLSEMSEEERPSKVIIAIITDGQENASREYTKERIAEMIRHQEEVYSWEVMFLGAGLDAVDVARSYGICGTKAMSYDTGKIGEAFTTMASASLRGKKGIAVDFTAEEREANT